MVLKAIRRALAGSAPGEHAAAAEEALRDLFGLGHDESVALLRQGQRIRLLEHLWRVSFVDGDLSLYEDHYVRKIAHLLYVPNTQSMPARNRARG